MVTSSDMVVNAIRRRCFCRGQAWSAAHEGGGGAMAPSAYHTSHQFDESLSRQAQAHGKSNASASADAAHTPRVEHGGGDVLLDELEHAQVEDDAPPGPREHEVDGGSVQDALVPRRVEMMRLDYEGSRTTRTGRQRWAICILVGRRVGAGPGAGPRSGAVGRAQRKAVQSGGCNWRGRSVEGGWHADSVGSKKGQDGGHQLASSSDQPSFPGHTQRQSDRDSYRAPRLTIRGTGFAVSSCHPPPSATSYGAHASAAGWKAASGS